MFVSWLDCVCCSIQTHLSIGYRTAAEQSTPDLTYIGRNDEEGKNLQIFRGGVSEVAFPPSNGFAGAGICVDMQILSGGQRGDQGHKRCRPVVFQL